jgi:hypothetical protein
MSGDNLGGDISILLSSFPCMDPATIRSVLQVHNGDQEQAAGTLLAINEVLEGEVVIHKVRLNRHNCLLHYLT